MGTSLFSCAEPNVIILCSSLFALGLNYEAANHFIYIRNTVFFFSDTGIYCFLGLG